MGASNASIILRHILPNSMAPVIVLATLLLGTFVVRRGDADLPRCGSADPGDLVGDHHRRRARTCAVAGFPPPAGLPVRRTDPHRAQLHPAWATRCATRSTRGDADGVEHPSDAAPRRRGGESAGQAGARREGRPHGAALRRLRPAAGGPGPAGRVPHPRGRGARRQRRELHGRGRARRSASSASPGCGKSSPRRPSWASSTSPRRGSPAARCSCRASTCSTLPEDARRAVRADRVGMVFQDALQPLNPVFTVGWQLGELFRVHRGMSRQEAKTEAVRLLDLVGIPGAKRSGSTTTRTSSPAACASG